MAKAYKRRIKIKHVRTELAEHTILELTDGDVDFLLAILAQIGGSSTHSPRKYQVRIMKALEKATGHSYVHTDAYALIEKRGRIFFNDYPAEAGRGPLSDFTAELPK